MFITIHIFCEIFLGFFLPALYVLTVSILRWFFVSFLSKLWILVT